MISLFHIFSSYWRFPSLHQPPLYFSPPLFTPPLQFSSVKEGVVITALVIPDRYIGREYTSDPLRTVSGAVKHTHDELFHVVALLFTLFVFHNCNFRVYTHASKKTTCVKPRILSLNQEDVFASCCRRNTGCGDYKSSLCVFVNLDVCFQLVIWQLAASY